VSVKLNAHVTGGPAGCCGEEPTERSKVVKKLVRYSRIGWGWRRAAEGAGLLRRSASCSSKCEPTCLMEKVVHTFFTKKTKRVWALFAASNAELANVSLPVFFPIIHVVEDSQMCS
jgi:hypothetical protein